MFKRCIPVSILLILIMTSLSARADDLYSMILSGHIDEAKDSLSHYSSAASRDGRLLFCGALLEPDAAESARMLEASMRASVPARYLEDIYLRLCRYYLMADNRSRLDELTTDYLARWEGGRYEAEILRLAALAERQAGNNQAAVRLLDRYLTRHDKEDLRQWGEIDKAAALLKDGDRNKALSVLRKLSKDKSDDGVPIALYMLGIDAVDRGRVDDAVFEYNLLRESYPAAVGLDHLVDRLGGISLPSDNRAEKLTGTYYSIQVGVFSDKKNARHQADLFKNSGEKIDVTTKTVSGRKYNVVYVGRFSTFDEANRLKTKLENTHGAVYQVVAR